MNSAILCTVSLILMHLEVSSGNLGKELEASLDKAMQCPNREPPNLPVLALTPHRFAQLLAVIRNMSGSYGCVKPQNHAPFAPEDPKTWKFCLFGKCNWDKCECLPTFTGPNCNLFTKKCWLLYCFLSSCHTLVHSIYCVCDARYYGVPVTSGDYWYDDGKRNVFYPPPAYWQDDKEFPLVEEFGQTILNIPENNDPILAELGIPIKGLEPFSSKHNEKPGAQNVEALHVKFSSKENKKGKLHKRPNSHHHMQASGVQYANEKPNGSGGQSGPNNHRHHASGVEYADHKPNGHGSGGPGGHHMHHASGVEYADQRPHGNGSKVPSENPNHRLPSHKIESDEETSNLDDTTEDLKEVLEELANSTSNALKPTYPLTTVLVTVLNLYVALP